MAQGKVVLSKMAQAFSNALDEAIAKGMHGPVTRELLKARAAGKGVIWKERLSLKKQKRQQQSPAVSAEERMVA